MGTTRSRFSLALFAIGVSMACSRDAETPRSDSGATSNAVLAPSATATPTATLPPTAMTTAEQPLSPMEQRAATLKRMAELDAELGFGPCEVEPTHPWNLRIRPKNRSKRTLHGILTAFGAENAWCGDDGRAQLFATTAQLRALYGSRVGFRCVGGMGYSANTAAYFLDLEPGPQPRPLRPWVRRVSSNDDPKAELLEVGGKPCEEWFR